METIGGKIKWVDILRPTEKDLDWLKKSFSLHPIIISELKSSSMRNKIEASDGYLYLIYHFPIYDTGEKVSKRAEIDFLVTKKEVVSVRYDDIELLDGFKKTFGKDGKNPATSFELLYHLLSHLIDFNQRQLNHIQEKTEKIGAELFDGNETDLLKKISYLKRDLSEYQLIAKPQHHLFVSLVERGENFWGQQSRIYFEDLLGEYMKLLARMEYYREAVMDFESTNNQLLNVRTNGVMKTFNTLAFSTFPMMLIAALFSMRTGGIPFTDDPAGFWIIAGTMAVVITVMLVFFKTKRWL